MPVVLVAAEHDGRRSCSTATAMYAALSPTTLLVSLSRHGKTTGLVRAAETFSLSALGTDQVEVAIAAGGRADGPDKFAELGIPVAPPDASFVAPSVAGAPVAWCCRRVTELPVGDHVTVVGEVVAVRGEPASTPSPLLRHDRQYFGLGAPLERQDAGGYPL